MAGRGSLSREQQPILDAILRRGSQISDPDKRRRYTRAAVATGLVESGLRNLSGGDADSRGWRQERSSLYRNPTNVKASVDRFFREAAQHDRGQSAGELAADVQRPASQYRGKYAQVMNQAAGLIQGSGGGARSLTSPEYLKFDPGDGSPITEALNVSTRVPRVSASAPELPSFVKPTLQTPSSPPVAPQTSTIDEALAQISANQPEISTATGGGRSVTAGGGAPSGQANIKELFWDGPGAVNIDENKAVGKGFGGDHSDHVHVAADRQTMQLAAKLAEGMGLNVGEYGKGITSGHAEGSFHYQPYGAMDVSGDTKKMKRFAHRVARM